MDPVVNRTLAYPSNICESITFMRGAETEFNLDLRPETVVLHAVSNRLTVLVRDRSVPLSAGEYVVISPFVPFSVLPGTDSAETYELIGIAATDELETRAACFSLPGDYTAVTPNDSSFPDLNFAFQKAVIAIDALPENEKERRLHNVLKIKSNIDLLCAELNKFYDWAPFESELFRSWKTFARAFEYICANLDKDVALDDIIAASGFSTYYFSHRFSTIFGETVMRYVNRLKLYKAVGMLIKSDKSISEVASCCGFASLAAFSSLFKKTYTITPKAMRKRAYRSSSIR